jgi:predicted transposase YbfD/YdcC
MRTALYLCLAQCGADVLIAVNHARRKGFRLIKERLTYGRRIPWRTSKREVKRGRDITWTLRAMPAPEWVVEQWLGSATIIAVRSHGIRDGKLKDETRYYDSSLRTGAKALLRHVRERWFIENSWHWVRDVPLREDAHRYRDDNGVQILATPCSLAINALRLDGTWSITNDSTNWFYQVEPAGMYAFPILAPVHPSCNAWAMNSGPLSIQSAETRSVAMGLALVSVSQGRPPCSRYQLKTPAWFAAHLPGSALY